MSNRRAVERDFKHLQMNPEYCKLLPCEAAIEYRTSFFKTDWEEDYLGVWTFSVKDKE